MKCIYTSILCPQFCRISVVRKSTSAEFDAKVVCLKYYDMSTIIKTRVFRYTVELRSEPDALSKERQFPMTLYVRKLKYVSIRIVVTIDVSRLNGDNMDG